MSPDFELQIITGTERPLEDIGHQLHVAPAGPEAPFPCAVVPEDSVFPELGPEAGAEMATAQQVENPKPKAEEVPVDEELATAVKGLLDRLGGRMRMWHIIYELHGTRKLDRPDYEDLMERMINLRRAGRVVNIEPGVFVSPGSPAAINHANRKAAKKRAKRASQARSREAASSESNTIETDTVEAVETRPKQPETRLPERIHRQTPAELEAMMRREFGGSNGKPYRAKEAARGSRRRSRHQP